MEIHRRLEDRHLHAQTPLKAEARTAGLAFAASASSAREWIELQIDFGKEYLQSKIKHESKAVAATKVAAGFVTE